MNMTRLFLTLSVVILTGITGCDSDSSTKTATQIAKTGVFLDNEVAGLSYNTETQSGVTGPGGEYQYISGESITFSVGGINLPTALAQAILTPLGLVGTANTNNTTVLNIVKLLLSVDEDGDSSNGIQVSERAHAFAAGMSVDFNSNSFDSDVTELVANSGSVNTELIDDATALAHIEATIASLKTAPDIFTQQWLSAKTLYSVRYSTSDKMSVVKQLEFNLGATVITEIGLLNSNTNEVISVEVSPNGLLHETNNPIHGRKVVCDSSDQYVKTHVITNGLFNTVDLLFFDETQALEFADTLTEDIPPCSFEINPTVNRAPVANRDSVTVNEDTIINLAVLGNDYDEDGDTIAINSATASNGMVTIEADKTLTYTPSLNFNGTDIITYQISDNNGDTATSTVAMTITPVNDAPIANSDDATINEDSLSNINILSNDTDLEDDTLTVTAVTASNGDVSIKPDQTLDYLPNPNFNGTDTINYTISDGTLTSDSTVNLIITAINDAPIISPMSTTIAENSANATPLITMIGSDVDTGDTLTYSILSNSDFIFGIDSSSGQLSIADNTSLNYESAIQHEVVIKVEDSGGLSNTAIATVDVTNVVENVTPTLDATFGVSGTASSSSFTSDNYDLPADSVFDTSGKLIVVGSINYSNSDIYIARFNTDGTLDRTFGNQGVVNQDLGFTENPVAVAIDSIGRIVVTGASVDGASQEVFVARFTPTGELDTSFNSSGYRTTAFGGPIIVADLKIIVDDSIIVASSNNDAFEVIKFASDGTTNVQSDIYVGGSATASAMVLQSDGKVVVTGAAINPGSIDIPHTDFNFAAARFNVSSTPSHDPSYGASGTLTIDFSSENDVSYGAYITSNDEIVMVGSTIFPGGNQTDMAVIKLDADGQLISNFGVGGLLIVDIDGDGDATSNRSLGKAVTGDASGNLYFAVDKGFGIDNVIYKTDTFGSAISAYGTAGQITFDHNSSDNTAEAILIDSSNNAVLLTTSTISAEPDAVVARFTPTGNLDTSFNTDGYNSLDPTFSSDTLNEMIELTAAPHAGKFVAIGTSDSDSGSKLIVARYNADGSQDETFGHNGYYVHTSVETTITGQDIVELSDGRLVAVGTFDGEGLVLMIKNDGTLDTSFAANGENRLSGEGYPLILNAVAIDNNNKIIVGGNDDDNIYLARMELTGTPDNTFDTDGVALISLFVTTAIADIAVLSDNAIIAVGQKGSDGLIAKITSEGVLDTAGFASSDGYVSQDLNPDSGTNIDMLKRVKVKSDGKIVVAGYSTSAEPNNILVQFNSNGTLDTTFSDDGIASHNYGVGTAQTLALALDTSDNILVTGFNSNGSNDDIFVARVTATGNKDTLFNNTGGKLFDYTGAEAATAILVRSDGTLVIAGADNLNLFPTNFFFLQKLDLVEP